MPPRRYGSAKPLISSVSKAQPPASSTANGDAAEETESIATASHQDNGMEFEFCSNRSALDDELDFSSSTTFRTKALSSASSKVRKDSPVEVVDVDAPSRKRPTLPEKKSNQTSKKPVKHSEQETKQTKVSAAFIGEFGQVRSKLDDIEFILDGLHPSQSSEVRTNSVMSLAKLCKDSETRGLFRSHSLLEKVLDALRGVTGSESNLALAAAVALYFLCTDASNLDLLDVTACQILVQAMVARPKDNKAAGAVAASSSIDTSSKEFKELPLFKRRRLEEQAKKEQGTDKKVLLLLADATAQLDLPADMDTQSTEDLLTTEHLMVAACTSLSHRHAPFRDTFREVGGLTVFCNILMDSLLAMTLDKSKLPKMHVPMWRLVRDMKLLEPAQEAANRGGTSTIEAVTFMNQANQTQVLQEYTTVVQSLVLLSATLTTALRCKQEGGGGGGKPALAGPQRERMEGCRLAALKVLVNLTNHNPVGWSQFYDADGVGTVLAVLEASSEAKGMGDYDALTLGLGLLINTTEAHTHNRITLSTAFLPSGERALSFLGRLFQAKVKKGENGRTDFKSMPVDLLVVAAYTSVLIGCAVKDNEDLLGLVYEAMGSDTVRPLVEVLEYFIVCHEEADKGQTASSDFIDSLSSVLQTLAGFLKQPPKA